MEKKTSLIIVLAVFFLSSLYFLPDEVQASPDSWWNTSWGYRKSHNITGSSGGNQTNYQMNITVINGIGTDSGATVYIDNKARSDFGDVRFAYYNYTDSTEVEIDYWNETTYNGENATFWLEVPFISNITNNTIYIYYGNSIVNSVSNGTATFEFFDDFDDLNKWTINYTQYTPLFEQTTIDGYSVGRLQVNQHDERIYIKSNTTTPRAKAVEARIKHISWNSDGYQRFRLNWINSTDWLAYFDFSSFSDLYYIIKDIGGSQTTVDTYSVGDPSGWYIYEIYDDGINVNITRDSTNILTGSIPELQDDGYLYILNYEYNGGTTEFAIDYIRVRKYTSPEPSHGDWGSQETFVDNPRISSLVFNGNITTNQTITIYGSGWSPNGTTSGQMPLLEPGKSTMLNLSAESGAYTYTVSWEEYVTPQSAGFSPLYIFFMLAILSMLHLSLNTNRVNLPNIKGISPLVAVVIIVAFLVAVAILAQGFFTSYLSGMEAKAEETSSTSGPCYYTDLRFEDIVVERPNMTFTISNNGQNSLTGLKVFATLNDTSVVSEYYSDTLGPAEFKTFRTGGLWKPFVRLSFGSPACPGHKAEERFEFTDKSEGGSVGSETLHEIRNNGKLAVRPIVTITGS